ncbi:MAG: iron-containing alcohol dehydrogenase [Candidatus Latescibacterota bacterium]
MAEFEAAEDLLRQFKGDGYIHGLGVLPEVGRATAALGRRAALVVDTFPGSQEPVYAIRSSLQAAGVRLLGQVQGAAPNAPREDLARITGELVALDPDVVVGFGGGSTLDAVKAADVLRVLGGGIEDYFGTGLVTRALEARGRRLTPFVAIQTAASSGAHLTKYSNITDVHTGQKKLIVDPAIVPVQPVFDYEVTLGAPPALTADGALDGIAHSLEVLYDSVGKPYHERMRQVAAAGIGLVVEHLPHVMENPPDARGRRALGLATDLGGYAIMLGGTNGAHLTSFSLVDVLSHGRACAILNPYYMVFFAPAVEEELRLVGGIFRRAGYTDADVGALGGRDLGMAVARAMIAFERRIGSPATLGEVPGFGEAHIQRALAAAKMPQLRMKLENMPVRLTPEMVDEYMGPVLQAARTGDLGLVRNV